MIDFLIDDYYDFKFDFEGVSYALVYFTYS